MDDFAKQLQACRYIYVGSWEAEETVVGRVNVIKATLTIPVEQRRKEMHLFRTPNGFYGALWMGETKPVFGHLTPDEPEAPEIPYKLPLRAAREMEASDGKD
jgi:hypothetical protein